MLVHHDDLSPLAMVNKVGLPQVALPTFFELSTFSRILQWWPKYDLGLQYI
jgi:hypothetical protein